jgi:hypothetical protein
MIFRKGLLRYWIAFDQPGVLHVGLLVIEKFEKEESNHCAALSISSPLQLPKRFSSKDWPRALRVWGISRTAERKIPLLRLTYALHRLLGAGMSLPIVELGGYATAREKFTELGEAI